MKKDRKDEIMADVETYLDSLEEEEVQKIPPAVLKSLLYEIRICNWRQVTNIGNEIKEIIASDN